MLIQYGKANRTALRIIRLVLWIAALAAIVACWTLHQHVLQTANSSTCKSSLQEVVICMSRYIHDSHGSFPPLENWTDEVISKHMSKGWNDWCVAVPGDTPTYALNAKLKGLMKKDVKDPSTTVMLFESVPGNNLSGGPELFPNPPRHPDGHAIAFVDGHIVRIKPQDISKLNWDPTKKMKR